MNQENTFRRANERIAGLAKNPVIASEVERIRAETANMNRLYVETLAEIREASALTQTVVAQALGVEQAAVSKIERRKDLLLSTLYKYLTATGAEHPRIVVEKDGIEISLDLGAFATR